MQSNCLNESDRIVKRAIKKYGRERVYSKWIENGYIWPSSFEDSQESNIQEAKEYIYSVLPSIIPVENVNQLNRLISQQGITGNLLGTFFNNTIYLRDNTTLDTTYHEVFHAVFQSLLTPQQQNDLLRIGELKLNKRLSKSDLNINKLLSQRRKQGLYENLSEEEAKQKLYEEELAEQFVEYKQRKSEPKTLIEKIFNWILNLADYFNSNAQLKKIFQQIDSGYFVDHKVKSNPESIIKSVPDFDLYYGSSIDELVSKQERDELVRGLSSMTQNKSIDELFNDLKEEYNVSEEDIQLLGELKGYTQDEIDEEFENLKKEILRNIGYPILSDIINNESEVNKLKNAVENYQYENSFRKYLELTTFENPEILGDTSEAFNPNELYKKINEHTKEYESNFENFFNFYNDLGSYNNERFFSKFLEDVFGENKKDALNDIKNNIIPSTELAQNSDLFNNFMTLFNQDSQIMHDVMNEIKLKEDEINKEKSELRESNKKLNNDFIVSEAQIQESMQEVC